MNDSQYFLLSFLQSQLDLERVKLNVLLTYFNAEQVQCKMHSAAILEIERQIHSILEEKAARLGKKL